MRRSKYITAGNHFNPGSLKNDNVRVDYYDKKHNVIKSHNRAQACVTALIPLTDTLLLY